MSSVNLYCYTLHCVLHTNECTSYILYLSTVYIKTLKIPLHVSILRSSSGSTYCSLLKLYVKIVNMSLTISDVAAYRVFVYVLFSVQRGM